MSEVHPGRPSPPQSTARLPPVARWFVTSFFLISSALNYLDRLLLASLAPVLMAEFHLSKVGYANLLAAFSVTYALGSPILGYWMDRAGLTAISTLAVGVWSAAGMATGWVYSASQLLWCRIGLGAAEAGGIPGTGKVYGIYLLPKERALGAGVGQLAISAGSLAAPLLAAWSLRHGDWRMAFEIAGGLGLFWILGWFAVSRRFPPRDPQQPPSSLADHPSDFALLRDARFWRLLAANFLWMSIYTLWPNWTTVLLTTQFPLSVEAANRLYAWIPPLGATAGALLGRFLIDALGQRRHTRGPCAFARLLAHRCLEPGDHRAVPFKPRRPPSPSQAFRQATVLSPRAAQICTRSRSIFGGLHAPASRLPAWSPRLELAGSSSTRCLAGLFNARVTFKCCVWEWRRSLCWRLP